MHPTLVTTALGRRGRHVLAVTLAAAAGVSGAIANGAQAAQVPPGCDIVACPDLVVSRVEGGPNSAVYVTVRNIGLRRAGVSTVGYHQGSDPNYYAKIILALDPSEAQRITFPRICSVGARFTFVADHGHGVTESNEHNNRYTFAC